MPRRDASLRLPGHRELTELHGYEPPPIQSFRDDIAAALPEFRNSTFRLLNDGWDSVALEADGQWIFKFPREEAAAARLRRECSLLAFLQPSSPIPLPAMALHESPRLFSLHRKLPGSALKAADYHRLPAAKRDALVETLAGFYAWLHAIPLAAAGAAGASPIDPWPAAEEVLARAAPALPAHLVPYLRHTMAAYRAIPETAGELVYGYFDGHGWNMAFDHALGRLNGLYDFADSGFGPRHQDLSYTNWISPDLTLRIIGRYERLTGHAIDRGRVMLYSAALRLVEFAGAPAGATGLPRLQAIEDWFRCERDAGMARRIR